MSHIIITNKGAYVGPYPKKGDKGYTPFTAREANDAASLMNRRSEQLGIKTRYEVKEEDNAGA